MSHRVAEASLPHDPVELSLRAAAVALTLATSWVHFTLGGLLFLMNAVGYERRRVA